MRAPHRDHAGGIHVSGGFGCSLFFVLMFFAVIGFLATVRVILGGQW